MSVAMVGSIAGYIEALAPLSWAESWDNVGLQVGDPSQPVNRLLVALELTDAVLDEAVLERANLLVLHHPPIFKPLESLRFDAAAGRRLQRLIRADIALYAAHTNFDQASGGTNDSLATALGLLEPQVLQKTGEGDLYPSANPGVGRGHGRIGHLSSPANLGDLAQRLKAQLGLSGVRLVGDPNRSVERVAVGAGSGGMLIPQAIRCKADVLVTGDVGHHDAWDATDGGLSIIDIGHFASEQLAMAPLAKYLRERLAADGLACEVLEAKSGRDPFWSV